MITLDTVWVIALPEGRGIVYAVGRNRAEAWERAAEVLGTGHTRYSMERNGYRAVQADVVTLGGRPVLGEDEVGRRLRALERRTNPHVAAGYD